MSVSWLFRSILPVFLIAFCFGCTTWSADYWVGKDALVRFSQNGRPVVLTGNTAKFYFTLDDSLTTYDAKGRLIIRPQKIREASLAQESRPAKDDPEGHWGAIIEGFQLSIRFRKRLFCSNEVITATCIIRNVAEQPLIFETAIPDYFASFTITYQDGATVLPRNQEQTKSFQERLRSHLINS
jgi:hypothetical protein